VHRQLLNVTLETSGVIIMLNTQHTKLHSQDSYWFSNLAEDSKFWPSFGSCMTLHKSLLS